MKLNRKSWLLLPLTALMLAGCNDAEQAADTAGQAVTNAATETGNAIEEGAETAMETAAEAGDAAADAVNDAGAEMGLTAPAAPHADGGLTGAGASFPYPLYSKMFAEYGEESGVSVNYQSVGSGTGQKQIIAQTVDFGASDNAMDDEKLAGAPAPIAHIPMALGAVTVSYNVPGLEAGDPLKITGPVLADIYLGKITTWNDPAIMELNDGVELPPMPITVVRRSDSSGTTAVFTDYLSKISPEFAETIGSANSVNWPTGTASKGNDGVAGTISSTPGAMGYIEEAYAVQNDMPMMAIQNADGNFVSPTLAGVTTAAAGADMPDDMRTSVTNAAGADAYPLASYTYLLVYPEQNYGGRDLAQAERLQHMLQWMLTSGQSYHEPLHYARLPENVQERALEIVNGMTYDGQPMNPMQ